MDAVVAESGKKKRSSQVSTVNRFSLGVGNGKVDARRDGRTCLGEPVFRRERGNGKVIFPVPLTMIRIDNRTRLMPNLVNIMTSTNTSSTFCCCIRLLYPHHAPSNSPLAAFGPPEMMPFATR